MPISDLELYRMAQALIKAHGEKALLETTNRADLALKTDDPESAALWKRIGNAVVALQALPPDHLN